MNSAAAYYRSAAAVCGMIAAVIGFLATRIEWRERLDFDVLGVGWLLMNVPGLALSGFALMFAAVAVYCLVRSYFSS